MAASSKTYLRQTGYYIISPVRDEETYLEKTIVSVINQTLPPLQWILVDDGSTDGTAEILAEYSNTRDWIRVINTHRKENRQPGSPVIEAFNRGYELVKHLAFDFIVKLDCDLQFDESYFARLIAEFAKNPKLGIASGVYWEDYGKGWHPVAMPYYHAAGASKVIRKKCFEEIGGFIPKKSWDTVDEIRAQTKGWETRHFKDIPFYHLKNEGSGIGPIRTAVMLGEISYLTGINKIFFLGKVLHNMVVRRPIFIGGFLTLWGYLKCLVQRRELLVSPEEIRMYRSLLMTRLFRKIHFSL